MSSSAYKPLSKRQEQVLSLRAGGLNRKEIAFELGISPKTVEHYFHGSTLEPGIYDKLGIRDVALLTQWALQRGLVKPYAFPSIPVTQPNGSE